MNTLLLGYTVAKSEDIGPQEIIDLLGWVTEHYYPSIERLGAIDLQPNLLETLEPLYPIYRAHIRQKKNKKKRQKQQ